jgi:hypothetical protein
MQDLRIFTESKADVKFLKDYIEHVFAITLSDNDFDTLGSWSGYKTGGTLKTSIRQNHDDKKISILILDANSDCNSRKEDVIQDFKSYEIPVKLFLFPNHSANGNFETLLAEIAVDRKIMECFLEYEKCVTGHPKPLNDSRIYSYLDMVLYPTHKDENGKDLRKEEFRNYRNTEHWNLKHEYLNPLKNFLQTFFTQ